MKIIIVIIGSLLFMHLLKKFIKSIFIYSIVEAKYQAFEQLTYKYSTKRLIKLQEDLNKVIRKLKKVIQNDEEVINKNCSSEDKAFWCEDKEKCEKMLHSFENELKKVDQEIGRREFFNAKW